MANKQQRNEKAKPKPPKKKQPKPASGQKPSDVRK
jgi:hypothetical protein